MRMTSLQKLHQSMISSNIDMQQFQVRMGAIDFDCLFSTRDEPCFTLSLTSRGLKPEFFLFPVKQGYWIQPYFDGFYSRLANLLNTGANSGNVLKPKDFLEQLNGKTPNQALKQRIPTPTEIIRLRPDLIEEREKPFFDAWIYWSKDKGKGPTKENQEKTRLLLGIDALNHSRRTNASSRWSSTDLNRTWGEKSAAA